MIQEPKEVVEARELILNTFNKLQFVESTHQYFLGDIEYTPVSYVIQKFYKKDDFNIIAERYAKKHGGTKEYWLDKWKFNNLTATMTGTRIHSFLEGAGWVMNGRSDLIPSDVRCQYIAEKNWMIPFHNKEKAGLQALQDMHDAGLWLVLNEARVYSGLGKENPHTPFAGTFDMLYYYDGSKGGDPGFIICDWKTNGSLTNDFARKKGRMMLDPFVDYYDEDLSHYFLQFSCYQIPLEDIGLKVIGRRLLWLKDDSTYEKFSTPDLTKQLRKYL